MEWGQASQRGIFDGDIFKGQPGFISEGEEMKRWVGEGQGRARWKGGYLIGEGGKRGMGLEMYVCMTGNYRYILRALTLRYI